MVERLFCNQEVAESYSVVIHKIFLLNMRNIYIEKVSRICPHCGKLFEGNHASYANHVRWCKDNPNREAMKEHMSNKLKNHEHKPRVERGTFTVTCHKCGKEFEVIEPINKFPLKERYYCCRSCANSRVKTDEIKQKTSESVNKYYESIGKAPIKIHTCLWCDCKFENKKDDSKFCSNKCRHEYERNYSKRTELENYRKKCSFTFALSDFPDEFDFHLIEEHGWYKAKNHGDNLSGISRDHMVSVLYGFENHIDPKIISHPANCKLLIHSDNSSKRDKCSITFEELLERIKIWETKYGPYIK